MANLQVEESDFGLFHLLRGALSADFRQSSAARHKLASLILRIHKGLCLEVEEGILVLKQLAESLALQNAKTFHL